MPLRRFALTAVCMSLLALAACSNTEATVNKRPHPGVATATATDGIQQITVVTGTDLRFHPSTLVVHPGRVRIVLINRTGPAGGPPHDLDISSIPGAYVPLAQAKQTQQVTFTAPSPGRYSFVCTIHANQGQTGTLVVESKP